jgi:U3 small nucleolar RNA-associated protein 21
VNMTFLGDQEATFWYRTGPGPPLLAAAGGYGVITVWNLEERKLHTVIKAAHAAAVTHLHFFPGEPLLMSSGGDNAVNQWIFDNADRTARRLRFRSGHAAPPRCVSFYGTDGNVLLTAAEDRAVRAFSIIQDQQSRELSQVRAACTEHTRLRFRGMCCHDLPKHLAGHPSE